MALSSVLPLAATLTLRRPVSLPLRLMAWFFFLTALIIVLLGMLPFLQKPYVGVEIYREGEAWVTARVPWGGLADIEGVQEGMGVVSVNGKAVEEFASGASFIPSRQVHSLTVKKPNGELITISDALGYAPWQTNIAGILQGMLALVFWGAAWFVWTKKLGLAMVRLFAVVSLSIAMHIASIMGAQYDLPRFLFLRTLLFIFIPALLLHFSLNFPKRLFPAQGNLVVYLIYAPALVLMVIYAVVAVSGAPLDTWFRQAVFVYMLLGLGATVVSLIYSYATSGYGRYQLQIRLVVTSALLGLLPLLGLTLLPQVIWQRWLVSPNIPVLGVSLVPVAFVYVLTRERLPTLTLGANLAKSYAQARSIAASVSEARDLLPMAASLMKAITGTLGVSNACLLVPGKDGFGVVGVAGQWAQNPLKQI